MLALLPCLRSFSHQREQKYVIASSKSLISSTISQKEREVIICFLSSWTSSNSKQDSQLSSKIILAITTEKIDFSTTASAKYKS